MTTRRHVLAAGLCFGSGLILSACSAPPPPPGFPDLRFTDQPPFLLRATQVEIRTLYQPTDAESGFPVPPVRALQNWARDRLRANGQGGPARFSIANASATTRSLPIQGGISGTFTDQVSQQYDIAVDAALEILDASGAAMRTERVTASRSRSVLQSATANDRDRVRYEMVRDLMAEFDNQMQARITGGLGPYLVAG